MSESPSLIPSPRRVEVGAGAVPRKDLAVHCEEPGEFEDAARQLAEDLGLSFTPGSVSGATEAASHGRPSARDTAGARLFVQRVDQLPDPAGPEAYRLDIRADHVTVQATHPAGVARAAATLRQLGDEWPAMLIHDAPVFEWRGLLLDCCRHFMDLDYVLRTVDRLAYHKMNRLHWHLTEDQGWRLEIRAFPKLTEIGAWRHAPDGGRYGGFYTQDEAREVVAYAARRHVTVVPEIELPGHATAAVASYPELSCTGGPFEVETEWGIFDDVYCAGNERTFEFLETVFDETLELFPSEFIHVGGDECPKTRWKECDKCQARMRDEGLANEEELQSYFIRRMGQYLHKKGRRLIGWDEILEGGLAPGATVQSWQGMEGAIAAAKAGQDTVVSPTSHAYFDYTLDRIDLAKAFEFDPVPPGLSAEERAQILGGECNMWTERAPQPTVDSRVFPRLLAFAERLWSGTDGEYGEFHARVQRHYPRLQALGVSYGEETA